MSTTAKEIIGMVIVMMAVVGTVTTLKFIYEIVIWPFVTWVYDFVSMFNDFRNYRRLNKRKN